MKPRYLEIQGLNSFIEKQKIDFSSLTEKGLFGIFGPTGSGKSTILDGITLALYGKITRDSSGYINSQCEKTEVKYEFEIGNVSERKIYKVDRMIKIDKNGGYKTSIARLIEKNAEKGDIPLAEGPTEVKNKIQEIIGLSLDDFTRAVVLPQGKFSEFLKLSGKERSNMLERIFGLEKYGKKLTIRIRTAKKENCGKLDVLTGEMKKYEGVSNEVFEKVKKEVAILKEEEEQVKNDKIKIENEYEKYKNIWELQSELKIAQKKYKELSLEKEQYEIKKDKVDKGKKVLNIKPYVENFKETLEKIKFSEQKFEQLEKELNELNINVSNVHKEYNLALQNKEEILPKLIEQETNLKRAIELNKQANLLKEEREDLVKKYKNVNREYKILKEKLEVLQNKRVIDLKNLEELNKKLEDLKIDPEYRELIMREINIYNQYEELKKSEYEDNKKLEDFVKKLQLTKDKTQQIKNRLRDKSKKLEEYNIKKEELNKKNPGESATLLEMQNDINGLKDKVIRAEDDTKKLNEINIKIAEKSKQIEQIKNKIEPLDNILKTEQYKKKDLKEKIDYIFENNMAAILASKLEKESICPVCGSKHHPKVAIKAKECSLENEKVLLEQLEESIKRHTNENESFKISLASLNSDNKHYEEEKKQVEIKLKDLDLEQLKRNLEKKKENFQKLKIDIENYNNFKLKLDNEIVKLKEEKNEIEKELTKSEQTLKNHQDNSKILKDEIIKLQCKLTEIVEKQTSFKNKFNINNISDEYERMVKADKEKVKLEKLEINLRNSIAENDKIKEKLQEKSADLNSDIVKIVQSGEEKKKEINRITQNIEELSYGQEPDTYIKIVHDKIQEINNKELALRKTFEEIKKNKENIEKEKVSEEKNKDNLYNMKEKQEDRLKKSLEENGFENYKEAEKYLMDKELIENMQKDIEKYSENLISTKNDIKRIENKLEGKSIEEENWEILKKNRVDIDKIIEEKVTEKAEKNSKLLQLDQLLKEKIIKEKEKLKLEHKASLLEEMDKLILGNKLVDFVSMNQLKYIALDASRRLKDITRERYALEINEDGEFIIRDDFNGGIRRTTSTLSGGETFLASLSLSLALSSQVQLKGNAPLEFFFLDEGFGTLDSELLDTVINSLEKLHSERLCVGIISHVEELKNRVPIKLLVVPATVGEGGTRVKMEVS